MHLFCAQTALAEALDLASQAVPSKAVIPILSHVLLSADPRDGTTLTATDLEIGILAHLEAELVEPGRLAVPAKLLLDLVKRLPATDRLELRSDDRHTLTIAAPRNLTHIRGQDAEQYPRLAGGELFGSAFFIESAALKVAIESSAFAASKDTARPTLTGVYLDAQGEQLYLVGADSFRLARAGIPFTGALPQPLLIPARALLHLARILPPDDTVECHVSERRDRVKFVTRRLIFHAHLLSETFPEYRRMYPDPERLHLHITAPRDELLAHLRRAMLFAPEGHGLTLDFQQELGGWQLRMESSNQEVGRSQHELPVEAEGDPMSLVLNSTYLKDALEAMESERVRLEVQSPRAALVLTPVGGEARDSVLMPMFVNR
jgi:DNA polymerase-3 subunit beta